MSSHLLQERIDRLQAQRAAQWLELLQAGRSEDKAAFSAWCRESPVHIREFLEASWTHQELARLEAQGQAGIDALLAEITPQVQGLPLEHVPMTANSVRSKFRWLAAAATIVLVAGASLIYWQQNDVRFTTDVGEQHTVELPDTSLVKLNTNSSIAVNFESHERNIDLRRGEAIFKVAHDATRPFRVHTRAAVITAIGTQFNIYERPVGTDVTVLEGRVRIVTQPSSDQPGAEIVIQELAAGEEARIAPNGTLRRVGHADLQRVTAWSKRRLKFEHAPLEEMVEEFNRYNRTQIRIEDIAPNSRFYRGLFDADDPNALAELMAREPDLVVERRGNEILIRGLQRQSPQQTFIR